MNNQIKSCGIVLRRQASRRYSISLLDRQLGRIEGFPASELASSCICNGSLVEYNVEDRPHGAALHDIQLLERVAYESTLDMRFFHHLLEVAYYGIPIGAGARDIFDLLLLVQQELHVLHEHFLVQKLLVAKLLLLLGFEIEVSVLPVLNILAQRHDVESLGVIAMTDIEEYALDAWIVRAERMHPCAQKFKTIQFLDEVRLV